MLLPSPLSVEPMASLSYWSAKREQLKSDIFSAPRGSPSVFASSQLFQNLVNQYDGFNSIIVPTTPPPSISLTPTRAQLPTPPLTHAKPPPKLQLRSGSHEDVVSTMLLRRIARRKPSPSGNKRVGRSAEEDESREKACTASAFSENSPGSASGDGSEAQTENEISLADSLLNAPEITTEVSILPSPRHLTPPPLSALQPEAPSTPKPARIAPEQLPLGLQRSDYHELHASDAAPMDTDLVGDGFEWTGEDDRILVELVLDKVKLSKTQWQDCARCLGRNRTSVDKRWTSLMLNGHVGLKAHLVNRRAKLGSTWR